MAIARVEPARGAVRCSAGVQMDRAAGGKIGGRPISRQCPGSGDEEAGIVGARLLRKEILRGAQRPPITGLEITAQDRHALGARRGEYAPPRLERVLRLAANRITDRLALAGPGPEAEVAVGHASRRRNQQAPVAGPPHLGGREAHTTTIGRMVLVIGLDVDDRARRPLQPIADVRAFRQPAHLRLFGGVTALIDEKRDPGLIAKLVADPGPAKGMHRHQRFRWVAVDGGADRLPAFRALATEVAVAAERPGDVIGAPAGAQPPGESDELSGW